MASIEAPSVAETIVEEVAAIVSPIPSMSAEELEAKMALVKRGGGRHLRIL